MNTLTTTFLTILIMALFPCSVINAESPRIPDEIIIDPTPGDGTGSKDRPRMPVYSPIRVWVYQNEIVVYSTIEGYGEVNVYHNNGSHLSFKAAELSEGISIELPNSSEGVYISVIFNGTTYSTIL